MPARCSTTATDGLIGGEPFALDAVRALVVRAAERFDARLLDRAVAVDATGEWAVIVHAAEAALAIAAARVAECGPPPSAGARDAAEFVAKTTGTTSAKAKEKINTGKELGSHPRTRAEAVAGKLSSDQTAAITDALSVNPRAEQKLLGVAAEGSLGALRDACATSKAEGQDLATIEKRIHAKRSLRRYRDKEGVEHLHAAGTKATMARVDQALRPIIDNIFKRARTDGMRESLDAYAYDALITLAERSVEAGDSSASRPKRTPTIRNLAVLRLDLSALVRGRTETDETCEIAGLGPISVETAREMLGESIVKLVITKGLDVRNVTHLGRAPTIAQKIALLWEQPVCMREGCNRTARLEYNHSYGVEYHKTKHTRVDETEPLCDPDHDLQTNFGWSLVVGKGKRPMVPPDDPRHPKNRPPP